MDNILYDNGYAYVDGYKFRKDDHSGYYLCTKKIDGTRKRLHIYIYEKNNGPIEGKLEINHVDGNKDNNDASNLEAMSRSEHLRFHYEKDKDILVPKWRKSLDIARLSASEWHKSPEGRKAHSALRKGKKQKREFMKNCAMCQKTYRAALERSKFCSPSCQSAFRKQSGVDDEQRTCVICNKVFKINKYSKKRTCSRSCAGILSNKSKAAK